VWCGSPIRHPDGHYLLLYSRWRHGTSPIDPAFDHFKGWLRHSEIAVARSSSACGPYEPVKVLLSGGGDGWDACGAHNPLIRVFGGKAYLYYVSHNPANTPERLREQLTSTWMRHQASQRIGVAVAGSLDELIAGRFTKKLLLEPDFRTSQRMAVNPAVTELPDGRFLLAFKTWDRFLEGRYTMMLALADHPAGPYEQVGTMLRGDAVQAEDPCLWHDGEVVHAVVKDFAPARQGALTPQFGALAHLVSRDGMAWSPASEPVASLRELRLTDGTVRSLTHLERPQILIEAGTPTALFAAMSYGSPFDDAAETTMNVAIPVQV
jgi:hypothetical protein